MLDIQNEVVGIYKPAQTSTRIIRLWLDGWECARGVSVLRIKFCLNFLNINSFQTLTTTLRLNYTFVWDTLTPIRSSLSIWFYAWKVNNGGNIKQAFYLFPFLLKTLRRASNLSSNETSPFNFLLVSILSLFVVD